MTRNSPDQADAVSATVSHSSLKTEFKSLFGFAAVSEWHLTTGHLPPVFSSEEAAQAAFASTPNLRRQFKIVPVRLTLKLDGQS